VPAAELTALVAPAGDAPPPPHPPHPPTHPPPHPTPGLPHLAFSDAAAGTGPEPTLVLLRTLAAEVERRLSACRDAGVARFDELPHEATGPRILCLVDDLQAMPEPPGTYGTELLELLASIALGGRTQGIHLLLALDPAAGPTGAEGPNGSRWTALPAQFPVRVALPGGDAVLEPANDSAAGLPLGTAVVNTAGGLGGPRGATRGHERVVQFPDPRAEPDTTRRLHDRLNEQLNDRLSEGGRNRPREVNEEVTG
jgi:hypothetical protein